MKNKDMSTQPTNAEEQYDLGNRYVRRHDYEEAFKWFKKAAEQGHPHAQYHLGVLYSRGRGVTQDYDLAFKWLTKSANQGNSYVQSYLDDMISRGK